MVQRLINTDFWWRSFVTFPLQDSTPLVVPAIVFGATSFSAGLTAMLLPETRGKPLPNFVGEATPDDKDLIPLVERKELAGGDVSV